MINKNYMDVQLPMIYKSEKNNNQNYNVSAILHTYKYMLICLKN